MQRTYTIPWNPRRDTKELVEATVEQRHVGWRSVVVFAGELDIATAPQLERALDDAIAGPAAELWVDLSEVRFMGVAGVHCLERVQAALRGTGRRLVLVCPPSGPAARALRLCGVTGDLPSYPNRAAAHRAG